MTKIKNEVGPKIEPWGTPEVTVTQSDSKLLSTTLWNRPHKYESNQDNKLP